MANGKKVEVRCMYLYDGDEASLESSQDAGGPSLTVQSDLADADINVLMDRFGIGPAPPENVRMPLYGDFTEVTDFRSALHSVMEAERSFMAMPARVRSRFENDPQKFLEFCGDVKNEAEAVELGLVNKPLPPAEPKAAAPAPVAPVVPTS